MWDLEQSLSLGKFIFRWASGISPSWGKNLVESCMQMIVVDLDLKAAISYLRMNIDKEEDSLMMSMKKTRCLIQKLFEDTLV